MLNNGTILNPVHVCSDHGRAVGNPREAWLVRKRETQTLEALFASTRLPGNDQTGSDLANMFDALGYDLSCVSMCLVAGVRCSGLPPG